MQHSSQSTEQFAISVTETVVDDLGDQVEIEPILFRGFAKVSNLNSREFWEASALGSEQTRKFFTRWFPVLDEIDLDKARISWRGKKLSITSVDNVDMRNEMVIIRAKEVRK